MKIGLTELIVIFIVALVVLGPDKLPYYAKKLGEALAQFKKYSAEATKEIKENIVDPLEEAQRPLKEAMQPFEEIDKAVRGNVNDIKKSFNTIGKGSVPPKAEETASEDATTKDTTEETAANETTAETSSVKTSASEEKTVEENTVAGSTAAENTTDEAKPSESEPTTKPFRTSEEDGAETEA